MFIVAFRVKISDVSEEHAASFFRVEVKPSSIVCKRFYTVVYFFIVDKDNDNERKFFYFFKKFK